jgi:putative NADPH-quinone reductase
MKTVIVYNHPFSGSLCHALLESARDGAKKAGYDVDVIDLDADKFNPVMNEEELRGFLRHEMIDPQAKDYFERIRGANHLIIIFPIWWGLMPALMKGFIDKVVFPGAFYEMPEDATTMTPLLPNLKVTIITTMNTPADIYRDYFGDAIYKALVNDTFNTVGIKNVEWVSFNMVKFSTEEQRREWLEKAAQVGAKK